MQAAALSAAFLHHLPVSFSLPTLPHLRGNQSSTTCLFPRCSNLSSSFGKILFSSHFDFLSFSWSISPIRDPKRQVWANAASGSPSDQDSEKEKLAQVSKRLEDTARYFKRLGSIGFWGQLLCTIVSAVILSFSTVVTGKIATPVTFYPTAGAIAVAFISVFWFFGYIRLSEKLQRTANEPSKAPPRAEVVKNLKNGIVLNVLGMGAAILGMQATIGLLVAKALTTLSVPYYQGIAPGKNVVLAMDVFLVQSSSKTVLSHLLGLVLSLELLRSVTVPHLEAVPIPRAL
ncbi:protein TIC 21, chloroplastic-like [Zingiber officinale]|uniref:protein TIC 21, chloroplastic-like n=1 Tax=Zingiber officinale TaxID=94328 RepID=UPI001C4BFE19|nr:protein TIC 21, chloroplastic-like [Zingiber officinale]